MIWSWEEKSIRPLSGAALYTLRQNTMALPSPLTATAGARSGVAFSVRRVVVQLPVLLPYCFDQTDTMISELFISRFCSAAVISSPASLLGISAPWRTQAAAAVALPPM